MGSIPIGSAFGGDGDVINLLRRWRHISPNGSQGFIRSLHNLAEIKGVSLGSDPEEAH